MARASLRFASGLGALACGALALLAATTGVQAQQVYRYVDKDGKVVYSDRAPPPESKDVQAKRLTPNYVESSELPYDTAIASQRFPVTLYTFACGDLCQRAEALLNRRGVPFTKVPVDEAQGAEQLKALTGEQQAPVLQVGDKLVAKGFNEARWQALLDEAGYPKTVVPRKQAARAPEPPKAAEPASVAAPPAGGGYPQ